MTTIDEVVQKTRQMFEWRCCYHVRVHEHIVSGRIGDTLVVGIVVKSLNKKFCDEQNFCEDTAYTIICDSSSFQARALVKQHSNVRLVSWTLVVLEPPRHRLAPHYRKMTPSQVGTLVKKYGPVTKFPRMLETDPMAQYLGFQVGDVLEILYGNGLSYRVVV